MTHLQMMNQIIVCVLPVGMPFRYVIPSFDVIAIEMRQMKIKGYTTDGEERNYDIFIRNDPSLCRLYPVWMVIRDGTVIEVRPPKLRDKIRTGRYFFFGRGSRTWSPNGGKLMKGLYPFW